MFLPKHHVNLLDRAGQIVEERAEMLAIFGSLAWQRQRDPDIAEQRTEAIDDIRAAHAVVGGILAGEYQGEEFYQHALRVLSARLPAHGAQ